MNKRKLWPMVVAIALVALLLSALLGLGLWFLFGGQAATLVEITQNGKLVAEIPLSEVTEPYTYTLEDGNGGTNTLLVTKHSVTCIAANCPDQVCVEMGEKTQTGQPITCLPHKLIIELKAEN